MKWLLCDSSHVWHHLICGNLDSPPGSAIFVCNINNGCFHD